MTINLKSLRIRGLSIKWMATSQLVFLRYCPSRILRVNHVVVNVDRRFVTKTNLKLVRSRYCYRDRSDDIGKKLPVPAANQIAEL
jgi:S1-C subfamily serine protease